MLVSQGGEYSGQDAKMRSEKSDPDDSGYAHGRHTGERTEGL